MSDGIDRVINEFWVVAKLFCVLHNQRLLRDEIIQIVHEKCSEAVVCTKLTALGQSPVRLRLVDMRCDMATNGPKQIMIFEIQ